MTQSREFYAPTVEQALLKASDSLGVAPEKLSYETIDTGSSGFLGIGGREARIMVELLAAEEPDTLFEAAEEESSETEAPISEESEEIPSNPPKDSTPVRNEEKQSMKPASDDLLKDVNELVSSIVKTMDIDARVETYDAEDVIAVDIFSPETGLIIGQKGETIDSLQHLVNVAVYKDHEFSKRIVLDSEGYRQRRIEAIQGMAHRTARKAVRGDQEIQLPPMNSSERRIVHMYLKENTSVTTHSEGTGATRRVTVAPNRD